MNKTIGIIGCGYLARIIGEASRKGLLPGYEILTAMSRKQEDAASFCEEFGGRASADLTELLSYHPDFVLEMASVSSVKDCSIPVLQSGASFIPLSIGAFSDRDFYEKAQKTAQQCGSKIYIPHGAVGGFDVLRTVSLMAEAEGKSLKAGISTRKGPASLRNTPVYRAEMEEEELEAFSGSCQDAIALLPTKVNVAVAQSLCTVGPEEAQARITSVPGYVGDEHSIHAEMDGIRVVSSVYSANSAIAGWSVVSLLRNLQSPVSFY